MVNIEVELRGPLNKTEFLKLKKKLETEGKFIQNKDRFTLMYFRDRIPKDIKEIEHEKVDLRIRITNKKPELILKYGLFTPNDPREEIFLPLELNQINDMIKLLKYLGWFIGVIYSTKTKVFIYKNIEFSLIEILDYGYSYEAEIITQNKSKVKEIKNKIRLTCKDLGLREYSEEEFNKQCNNINNKVNLQFNFNEQEFEEIRRKVDYFFN